MYIRASIYSTTLVLNRRARKCAWVVLKGGARENSEIFFAFKEGQPILIFREIILWWNTLKVDFLRQFLILQIIARKIFLWKIVISEK